MNITDLINFKRALTNSITVESAVEELTQLRSRTNAIKTQVKNLTVGDNDYIDTMVAKYEDLINQTIQTCDANRAKIAVIDQNITDLSHELYAKGYDLEEWETEVEFVRKGRALPLTPAIEEIVKQRLAIYTNWQYPALEIGCRDGEWTQYLVAADPLYIMDRHQEFLDNTAAQFNTTFQNRLRKYRLVKNDLNNLPVGQFGFVLSWNFFNYVSLDTITHMLDNIRELLRPGGVFMFSYNDGDTPDGAAMADSQVQTYMPKSILLPTCRAAGFEVLAEYDFEGRATWLELKRPGTLQTVKAHQVLGEIKPRNP